MNLKKRKWFANKYIISFGCDENVPKLIMVIVALTLNILKRTEHKWVNLWQYELYLNFFFFLN